MSPTHPQTATKTAAPPPPPTQTTRRNATPRCSPCKPAPRPSPGPPPLPPPPSPPGPPPSEAAHTSPPQRPHLRLARIQDHNGIALSWSVAEVDPRCAPVAGYQLYAYHHPDAPADPAAPPSQWRKIGEVNALALPMACTLTQFAPSARYYFAVRAREIGRAHV